jgi:hypothetical protein
MRQLYLSFEEYIVFNHGSYVWSETHDRAKTMADVERRRAISKISLGARDGTTIADSISGDFPLEETDVGFMKTVAIAADILGTSIEVVFEDFRSFFDEGLR